MLSECKSRRRFQSIDHGIQWRVCRKFQEFRDVMVRIVVVKRLHGLSDEQTDFQFLNRRSSQRFCGIKHSANYTAPLINNGSKPMPTG